MRGHNDLNLGSAKQKESIPVIINIKWEENMFQALNHSKLFYV